MLTVTIEEAQSRLAELIQQLSPGESLVIVQNEQPIAKLTAEPRPPRKLGQQAGAVTYMAPEFDAPLEDFQDYMA